MKTSMVQLLDSPKTIWWILLFHFCAWLSLGLFLDVHPDMADHWGWSRYLSLSYYEHPPLGAWTVRLATLIGGNNILTLKIGSVLFTTLIIFTAYQVGLLYYGRKVATMFALVLEAAPYFSIGSVYWHIDEPYMLAWLCGLYALGKYLKTQDKKWILVFGVCAGFGALGKYITILFYISLLIWCILDRRQRPLLLQWHPYAAGLISLLVFSPVIYWNATHDWVSFLWQFGRGLTGKQFGEMLPVFTMNHLGLYSLVFSIWAWGALFLGKLVKRQMSSMDSLLLITAIFPVLFFSIASLPGTVADPVWVNIAYFSLFLLLAKFLTQLLEKGKTILVYSGVTLAYVLNFALVVVTVLHILYRILPVPLEGDNSRNLMAWEQTSDQIVEILKKNGKAFPGFIVTREFQLAGALALYLPFQPFSHTIEKPERNQWSPVKKVNEKGAILVCPPKKCKSIVKDATVRLNHPFSLLGHFQTVAGKKVVRDLNVYWLEKTAL